MGDKETNWDGYYELSGAVTKNALQDFLFAETISDYYEAVDYFEKSKLFELQNLDEVYLIQHYLKLNKHDDDPRIQEANNFLNKWYPDYKKEINLSKTFNEIKKTQEKFYELYFLKLKEIGCKKKVFADNLKCHCPVCNNLIETKNYCSICGQKIEYVYMPSKLIAISKKVKGKDGKLVTNWFRLIVEDKSKITTGINSSLKIRPIEKYEWVDNYNQRTKLNRFEINFAKKLLKKQNEKVIFWDTLANNTTIKSEDIKEYEELEDENE